MGGGGTAFGALVGAALIEIIRNNLILLGISAFWRGTFVGGVIIVALLVDRLPATPTTDDGSRDPVPGGTSAAAPPPSPNLPTHRFR